jgi:hypothetical protein
MGYSYLVVKNCGSGIEPHPRASYRGCHGTNETPKIVVLGKKRKSVSGAVVKNKRPRRELAGF